MGLEKLAKKGKTISAGLVLALAVAGVSACGGGSSHHKVKTNSNPTNSDPVPYPNPPLVPIPNDPHPGVNDPPRTTIYSKNFGNGLTGNVKWTVCGADPDSGDYISDIDITSNGVLSEHFAPSGSKYNPYCVSENDLITVGQNTLEATAYDSYALGQSKPASDGFVAEKEYADDGISNGPARDEIESLLQAKGYSYDINLNLMTYDKDRTLGTSNGNINPDFLIARKDGSYAVVEYIGESDTPSTELSEKQKLDADAVPNLYMRSLPLSEIDKRFNSFANNNL